MTTMAAMVLYLLLLFGIAHYADKKRATGKSIVSNPYVYALTLCVYCTAWTFYGSIGRAATTGLLGFLPIYLGPMLVMILGWMVVRKMIRTSKEFRLTSISDFISFRYGRSYAIGSLVTVVSLMVITPYVALQLIAISHSITILSEGQEFLIETKLAVAVILGIFAVIFGARHLDPMERHEGLVAAIAFESMVKLLAFLAAGLYITYGIFDGYSGIVRDVLARPEYAHLIQIDYFSWFSLTMISAFAVLFLPRQFHVTVVENSDEKHLKRAMWLFPLYLLLINLFVPAIAGAGLLLGTPGDPDMFIVNIPHSDGRGLLALFVFIGGASAATAMVLVESVAVATMMLNDLEIPYLMRWISRGRDLPGLLLGLKRFNILLVVGLGYLYSRAVAYSSLVDIGLVSFLAASQMAPAALGGLYWKKGSREGAIAGLVSGFVIWIYTALYPTLVKGGWLSEGLLGQGPFGIDLLRPTGLFGLEMDVWSHSAFWSLLVNCTLYVLVSLMTRQSPQEVDLTESFVDVYGEGEPRVPTEMRAIRSGTLEELETTLARYIGEDKARMGVETELARMQITREEMDARDLLELWDRAERILTGSLGTSATRMIVEEEISVTPVAEVARTTQPSYELVPGKVYAVPEKAYEIFTDQITHGIEGLCITATEPEEVRRRWGFSETPIIRLSPMKGKGERYIAPTNLPLLFMTIKAFVEMSKNSVVLLDDLSRLIRENAQVVPEEEILDFVNQLEELSIGARTRMLLPVSPEVFPGSVSADFEEVHQLIFSMKPLTSYLVKVFLKEMISSCREGVRQDVHREICALIESGDLFDSGYQEGELGSSGDPEKMATPGTIEVDPGLTIGRRGFFVTLRRAAKVIRKFDTGFDPRVALGALLVKYGFSPFELTLAPGTTYVIEEDKPIRTLEIFGDLVAGGMDGLCISRYHPEKLHEKYDIPQEGIIWLTQKGGANGRYRSVDPTNFPRLSTMLSDFLSATKDPLILLEGMGYLITQSNYETVLRFIQSQRDEIALMGGILLVHIDPLSLDTKELHRLESEMETLETGQGKL